MTSISFLAKVGHCINMGDPLTTHLVALNILIKCSNSPCLSESEATFVSLFR